MCHIEWKTEKTAWGCSFKATVPIKTYYPDSQYVIYISNRPEYCDRGDWIIYIDGRNDVDEADGFPRYFFGSEDEVKKQMETWLSRRQAYKDSVAPK